MIVSFADPRTEDLFHGRPTPGLPPDIQRRAGQKLEWLHAAASPQDLRSPPGNRLERLRGDRARQWSIRINERWRICFRFEAGNAFDVEVVDYH